MAEQNNRIFIVDDDQAIRETLTEILSLKGYTAESAGTAEKAIEKIKDWPVDLFLIDLRMTGMGGLELLKKLDIMNNTYEAIMITAYAGMDSVKEAMEYGAINYISKPIMYKELAPLMKKALETVKLKKLRVDHVKELEEKVEARTKELKEENKKLKLVEKILSESEERYRNLSEQAPVGIGVATFDGKMVYMNWKMAEITGYSSDEIEKIGLASIYEDPKDRKKLIDLLNRDGSVNDFQVRLKRKDGTLYDAQLSVSKVRIGGQDLLQTICVDVTERKKIEEALRESEEKYSTLVEQSKDAVLIIQDGACVFTNKAVTDITGYTMKDLSGDNFWNFLAPESRERVVNIYKNRMAGKKAPTNYEVVIKHKDGPNRHAEITSGGIKYKGKQAVMGTLRDITERKKVEEALKESEDKLTTILQKSPIPTAVGGSDGSIISFNEALVKLIGYKQSEIKDIKDWARKLYPDKKYRDFVEKNIKQALAGQKQKSSEFTITCKDGSKKLIDFHTSFFKDGLVIQMIDITERKKAEEALKESEEKFKTLSNELEIIMDHIPALIFYKDKKNKFIRVNKYFADAFSMKKEDWEGKSLFDIYPKEKAQIYWQDDLEVIKSKKPKLNFEEHWDTPEGKRWALTSKIPHIDNKGDVKGIIATSIDITEKKKAEEALQNERDNLVNIFNSMEDGVYIVDQENNIQYVNKVLKREYGSYKGKKCYTYFHDRKKVCPWCKNKEVFKGKTVHWEWYSIKNNKTYDLIDTPLKNPNGSISKLEIFRDITERKQAEEALRVGERKLSEQNIMLQEKNIALREVMDQLEAEKDRLGKQINTNVDRLLLPLVTKLRSKGSSLDKTYIDLLEGNLNELASQFGGKLSGSMLRLTQKEIEMCNMIKQGLTSKEIAKLLDISHRTVETHRNNIRKKLGIMKQEVNLVTYLKNI